MRPMDDEHAPGTPLPQQAWPAKELAVEEYRSLRQEIKDRIKSIQLTFAGAIAISIAAFLRILGEVELTGRDDLLPAFLSIIPIGLLSASSYSIRSQYYDIWRNAAYIRVFFERRGEPGANWEQRQAGRAGQTAALVVAAPECCLLRHAAPLLSRHGETARKRVPLHASLLPTSAKEGAKEGRSTSAKPRQPPSPPMVT